MRPIGLSRRVPARGALLLVVLAVAGVPGAEEPTGTRGLDLAEAVGLTLRLDPQIQLAQQRVAVAQGQLQQAKGLFDQIFRVTPAYTYDQHANFPFLLNREIRTRAVLAGLAEGFQTASDQLLDALASLQLTSIECPDELELGEIGILEGREQAGLEIGEDFGVVIRLDGLGQDTGDFFEICIPSGDPRLHPELVFLAIDEIQQALGLLLNDLVITQEQINRELLTLGQNIAEAIAVKAQLAVDRLAEVPKDEESKTLSLEVNYLKPFRTGIDLGAGLRLQSAERNFKHKSLDPTFGGMGVPNQFPSRASISLTVPLLKGSGRVTVAAPERAAQKGVDAQRGFLRHAMTSEVFGTVLAYLDLRSAQERLALLEESAVRQRQLLELTRGLIDEGELAQVELNRVSARAALVDAGVSDARRSVLESRFVLANAIGLRVEHLRSAPLAKDALPITLVPAEAADRLIELALAERWDRVALSDLRDATAILRDSAKADTRQRLDFFVTGGYSTLYESPFFKFLPDEADPEDVPEESAVHYDRPEGVWRSLNESWEPFVLAGFTLNVAFKNNAAKGRLTQQAASLRAAEIELMDIDRSIRNNVISVTEALERARVAVERRRQIIDYQQRTLDAARELFGEGEISLIDVLTTEGDLTQERLLLVRAVQLHQSLLTRLQFETGTLLQFQGEETSADSVIFDPQPFVVQRSS